MYSRVHLYYSICFILILFISVVLHSFYWPFHFKRLAKMVAFNKPMVEGEGIPGPLGLIPPTLLETRSAGPVVSKLLSIRTHLKKVTLYPVTQASVAMIG